MSTAPLPRITELRVGDAGDLVAVSRVMQAAFDPAYGEAWSSAQCLGMLALPGVWLTLAGQDGVLVGFAMARAIAGDGELLLLAVDPVHRGHGVGGTLLRSIIADARDRGAERLHLEVRAGNDAVALYRAHGFAQVGQRCGYYRGVDGRAHDAQTYALQLV